jgi:hypothetical protein
MNSAASPSGALGARRSYRLLRSSESAMCMWLYRDREPRRTCNDDFIAPRSELEAADIAHARAGLPARS